MKLLKNTLNASKGPRVININVGKGYKKFNALSYSEIELKSRINEFICS